MTEGRGAAAEFGGSGSTSRWLGVAGSTSQCLGPVLSVALPFSNVIATQLGLPAFLDRGLTRWRGQI